MKINICTGECADNLLTSIDLIGGEYDHFIEERVDSIIMVELIF